ncbi:MAG: SDR family oxidoreductase [Betaproteobacteria bacterium]|nr:SDR family oxidoreductase [Betaproteobacteria bacterium]
MKSILIIGASRGLGLEMVRQYRADGWLTIGTTRGVEQDALLAHCGATALRVDVNDEATFANLQRALDGGSLDVAIYNAGILGPQNEGAIPCAADEFDAVMHTNVLGALRAIPIVAPALAKRNGAFAFISSTMGSIAQQSSARRVVYRASKAALNSVVKTASIEWGPKGVTCVSLHPGWVKTDMGGTDADIDPPTRIAGMKRVIAGLTPAENGKFFDYTGKEQPW